MPFGLWTLVGPRKHILDGGYIGATWGIRLNRPCAAAMLPFCQITLTTCLSNWPSFLELLQMWPGHRTHTQTRTHMSNRPVCVCFDSHFPGKPGLGGFDSFPPCVLKESFGVTGQLPFVLPSQHCQSTDGNFFEQLQ